MEFWFLFFLLRKGHLFFLFPRSCQLLSNKLSFMSACPKGKPQTTPARLPSPGCAHWVCHYFPPETCGLQKPSQKRVSIYWSPTSLLPQLWCHGSKNLPEQSNESLAKNKETKKLLYNPSRSLLLEWAVLLLKRDSYWPAFQWLVKEGAAVSPLQ